MKHLFKSIIFGLCAFLGSGSIFAISPSDVSTKDIKESRTFKFFEAGNTFFLRHDLNMQWPVAVAGFNDISSLQKAIISSVFTEPFPDLDSAIKSLDSFEKTDAALVDSIPAGTEKKYTAEEIATVSLKACNKTVLCFQIDAYSQNAGASGISLNSFLNYDMASGKVLSYKSTFVPGAKKALIKAIQAQLMKSEEIASEEQLEAAGYDFSMVENPENFYFDDQNFYFVFRPFEITSNTALPITVSVPMADVFSLLAPAAKAIVK